MRGIGITAALLFSPLAVASWYIQPNVTAKYANNTEQHRSTEQIISLGTKLEYNADSLSFIFDGRYEYDFVYNEQYSEAAKDEYQSRIIIDEAFLSGEWGASYWSFGYQKVVWGEADDLRVVDVVNPLTFKDYILFDVDDYRLSIPMIKLDHEFDSGDSLSVLTILEQRGNDYPPAGAEFGNNYFPEFDDQNFGEFELGVRFNTFQADTDISLYAFHGFQDDPVISMSSGEQSYRYEKFSMLAMSFSKPVDSFVLRTELAYFDNYSVNNETLAIEDLNKLEVLLGLDYRFKDLMATFQFTDRKLNGWRQDLLIGESSPTYTASIEQFFWSNQLFVRGAATYIDADGGGMLTQLKLTYKPDSNWVFKLNWDILNGANSNFIGAQNQHDRIWLAVTNYL